jgi:two-component system cell cycle response regulator
MKRILVIEDDYVQRQVLSEKITAEGFDVITAHDGESGYQAAIANEPNLILLDNRMPGMSGYQMLKKLRESGKYGEQVPVLFFSNIEPGSKEERTDIEAVQPTAYLLKSDTDLSSIVAKIKESLAP